MAIPIQQQRQSEKEEMLIRKVSSRYGGGELKLATTQTVNIAWGGIIEE
jgi:hypothetical protein